MSDVCPHLASFVVGNRDVAVVLYVCLCCCSLSAVVFDVTTAREIQYCMLHNSSYPPALPLHINGIHSALYRATTASHEASISLVSDPLPYTLQEEVSARGPAVAQLAAVSLGETLSLL